MGESFDDSSVDAVALGLDHPVRLAIVRHLADHDADAIELEALATALADELDRPAERLMVELHHSHLPKLDTAGGVEFDHRSGDVRYRPESAIAEAVENDVLED